MFKVNRKELIDEISLILSRCVGEDYGYFENEDLINLRNALQPAVDGWNDAESEYQHLVDIMGGGIEEYNYDNYIPCKEELMLLNKIESQKVDTFFYFMPKESVKKVSQDFIEHRTGTKLILDYENGVITINKKF